ncbi:MAG: hypothetical protein NT069_31415, partial [Planctomycetota bacterium]|nr:hypothetical protein [Planctomycetota bacterium]
FDPLKGAVSLVEWIESGNAENMTKATEFANKIAPSPPLPDWLPSPVFPEDWGKSIVVAAWSQLRKIGPCTLPEPRRVSGPRDVRAHLDRVVEWCLRDDSGTVPPGIATEVSPPAKLSKPATTAPELGSTSKSFKRAEVSLPSRERFAYEAFRRRNWHLNVNHSTMTHSIGCRNTEFLIGVQFQTVTSFRVATPGSGTSERLVNNWAKIRIRSDTDVPMDPASRRRTTFDPFSVKADESGRQTGFFMNPVCWQ